MAIYDLNRIQLDTLLDGGTPLPGLTIPAVGSNVHTEVITA